MENIATAPKGPETARILGNRFDFLAEALDAALHLITSPFPRNLPVGPQMAQTVIPLAPDSGRGTPRSSINVPFDAPSVGSLLGALAESSAA